MTTTATTLPDVEDLLTANDRCDSCRAQAYVLVILPEDRDLMFCKHHWDMYSAKLIEVAVDIIDETDKLERK